MTSDTNKSTSALDTLKSFEGAWKKVPTAPKKSASLTPYQATENAVSTMNGSKTYRGLDATLADIPSFAQSIKRPAKGSS